MEAAISMPVVRLIAKASDELLAEKHSNSRKHREHLLKDFPAVEANEFQDHVRCM